MEFSLPHGDCRELSDDEINVSLTQLSDTERKCIIEKQAIAAPVSDNMIRHDGRPQSTPIPIPIQSLPPRSSPLGTFTLLPTELQQQIISLLDFNSIAHLRLTNYAFKSKVDSTSGFLDLSKHASHVIRELKLQSLTGFLSFGKLRKALLCKDCVTCGEYGPYLFRLRGERCCVRCLTTEKRFVVVHERDEACEGLGQGVLEGFPGIVAEVEGWEGEKWYSRWEIEQSLFSKSNEDESHLTKNRIDGSSKKQNLYPAPEAPDGKWDLVIPMPYLSSKNAEVVEYGHYCESCSLSQQRHLYPGSEIHIPLRVDSSFLAENYTLMRALLLLTRHIYSLPAFTEVGFLAHLDSFRSGEYDWERYERKERVLCELRREMKALWKICVAPREYSTRSILSPDSVRDAGTGETGVEGRIRGVNGLLEELRGLGEIDVRVVGDENHPLRGLKVLSEREFKGMKRF